MNFNFSTRIFYETPNKRADIHNTTARRMDLINFHFPSIESRRLAAELLLLPLRLL